MSPERKLWLAENTANNLAKRLAWARGAPVAARASHMEIARDMLRVLTERMAACSSLSSNEIESELATRRLETP